MLSSGGFLEQCERRVKSFAGGSHFCFDGGSRANQQEVPTPEPTAGDRVGPWRGRIVLAHRWGLTKCGRHLGLSAGDVRAHACSACLWRAARLASSPLRATTSARQVKNPKSNVPLRASAHQHLPQGAAQVMFGRAMSTRNRSLVLFPCLGATTSGVTQRISGRSAGQLARRNPILSLLLIGLLLRSTQRAFD